jgi:hypothetical protein
VTFVRIKIRRTRFEHTWSAPASQTINDHASSAMTATWAMKGTPLGVVIRHIDAISTRVRGLRNSVFTRIKYAECVPSRVPGTGRQPQSNFKTR